MGAGVEVVIEGKAKFTRDGCREMKDYCEAKGLPITNDQDSFFLVNSIRVLSRADILANLKDKTRRFIDALDVIYETSSTNRAINADIPGKNYSILISEYQTGGLGRRKKN